jgi:hypothetical protein
MEYRFTDTSKTTITFSLDLSQVADLRETLVKAMDIEGISRWRVRGMIRTLAEAQRQAADIMTLDAKSLADAAKLDDSF